MHLSLSLSFALFSSLTHTALHLSAIGKHYDVVYALLTEYSAQDKPDHIGRLAKDFVRSEEVLSLFSKKDWKFSYIEYVLLTSTPVFMTPNKNDDIFINSSWCSSCGLEPLTFTVDHFSTTYGPQFYRISHTLWSDHAIRLHKTIKWLPAGHAVNSVVNHWMGPVRIRHSSHDFGWQSSHSVDLTGWQAKMASIEFLDTMM